MCGIFGIISNVTVSKSKFLALSKFMLRRGQDASGVVTCDSYSYKITRSDKPICGLVKKQDLTGSRVVIGHSRLITNGARDHQPVSRDGVIVAHNGIILDFEDYYQSLQIERLFQIDSEIIAALTSHYLSRNFDLDEIAKRLLHDLKGTNSSVILIPSIGKLCMLSNNGSLYYSEDKESLCFCSEAYPLNELGYLNNKRIVNGFKWVDIPALPIDTEKSSLKNFNSVAPFVGFTRSNPNLLQFKTHKMRRCSRCILTESMPFISFDSNGICNYCSNYKPRTILRSRQELESKLDAFRKTSGIDCIVPFSGGRDSSWALHLIVKELGLKPITYTYDWGMVTDLGRRNISRMCSALGVENIVIAADLRTKRNNIRKNLSAWLNSPHLGMISILTAGDKHFFKYLNVLRQETETSLNLWGINPLETTHFKSGFLGLEPETQSKNVYISDLRKQMKYQMLRIREIFRNPGYFNSSLLDTLSGEYYRSFSRKSDYHHIFDYWEWREDVCEQVLKLYDWETAPDTKTTWRIGDGTAAFYNYLYYTIAGFTEHDTFRSNQIREGHLSREDALRIVEEENRPRYEGIRWYLDTLNLEFNSVINRVNEFAFNDSGVSPKVLSST